MTHPLFMCYGIVQTLPIMMGNVPEIKLVMVKLRRGTQHNGRDHFMTLFLGMCLVYYFSTFWSIFLGGIIDGHHPLVPPLVLPVGWEDQLDRTGHHQMEHLSNPTRLRCIHT